MSPDWQELCALIDGADLEALAAAIGRLDPGERAAMLPLLDTHAPSPVRARQVQPEPGQHQWWEQS